MTKTLRFIPEYEVELEIKDNALRVLQKVRDQFGTIDAVILLRGFCPTLGLKQAKDFVDALQD